MNYDRAELKKEVKAELRQTKPKAILVTLVFLLFVAGATGLLGAIQAALTGDAAELVVNLNDLSFRLEYGMLSERELAEYGIQILGGMGGLITVSALFGLITAVVRWTFQFGYEGYCLDVARGEGTGFARLFCGFPRLGWVLLTNLLIGLFTTLWSILLYTAAGVVTLVFLYFADSAAGGLLAVLMVLAWIAATVGLVAITLRYSMAYYILLDEKVDSLEAISRSKAMMRGRKWHFFVLQMSFIGWYLLLALIMVVVWIIGAVVLAGVTMSPEAVLGGLTVLVPVTFLAVVPVLLWLEPYQTCARAKFYDWARHTDHADGVWEGTPPQAPDFPRYEEMDSAPEEPAGQPVTPPAPPEPPRVPDDVPDRPDYE